MLKNPRRLNQKGFATIEMIPVMIVIAVLLNFSLGFFGVIHTGILNSIAARNYAFETFRNRTNLVYFRDLNPTVTLRSDYYKRFNSRLHGIASENRKSDRSIATVRNVGFGMNPAAEGTAGDHTGQSNSGGIFGVVEGQRNEDLKVSPVWIRPIYGLCLNVKCEQ